MMCGARTGAWGGRRMYGAEVEYLESTGTQYINTETIPTLDTKVEAKVNTGTYGPWLVFFGVTSKDSANDGVLFRWYGGGTMIVNGWFCQNNYTESQIACAQNTDITVTLESGTITANGTPYAITRSGKSPYALPIYLFCGNSDAMAWRHSMCRIYWIKMTDNGELVRDLIPVRFANERGETEGAMYDRVSKRIFRNSGTGAFVIGPDKTT